MNFVEKTRRLNLMYKTNRALLFSKVILGLETIRQPNETTKK